MQATIAASVERNSFAIGGDTNVSIQPELAGQRLFLRSPREPGAIHVNA
jgi:hypothetical protein